MSDQYLAFANSSVGRTLVDALGLPRPPVLERFDTHPTAFSKGNCLIGAAPGGQLLESLCTVLAGSGNSVYAYENSAAVTASRNTELKLQTVGEAALDAQRFKTVVFDASGIENSDQLTELHRFFHPMIRHLETCSRIVILGRAPEHCETPRKATAQRALEGLTRSLGKEVKKGGNAQLVYVAPGAENLIESSLRFFLSPKSAYVSAQVVRVSPSEHMASVDWKQPLSGKVALVTGASRGIGEAIARTLARDGAHVICLDIPQASNELKTVSEAIGGSMLALDITDAAAPKALADHLKSKHSGVDIIVHNAGITRDKTLGKMTQQLWDMVINVNLSSEERINDELLAQEVIRHNGRVICVSSISGIAGNMGQTNYAVSKAGVIGMVQSMAPVLREKGITINAVAPGFIETQMTAAIPFAIREAGRRMNSMSQGGLPVDVAETIAWYANPASSGLNGNIVRVCGQSLLGA